MGLPQQSFGAGLEHGPAALFDLCLPASQLGKEIIHFLLHCGLGAQAQVGGHLLAHPVPDRLIRIDGWAVVANAAANFSVIRLGQLWSLILLTSALLPKSLYPTKAFRPGF